MKRWFWLIPLLLISSQVFAVASIFDIPSNDQSRLFLMQIFGRVGGVLSGAQTGNPLKDVLFYFNNVILIVGGLVILYSTIVSTVNTAHDGQILGKNWSSVWIPIRSAMGFALLLPLSGGYSVIQGLVMWVVLQGVGAADYVWLKYADGIARGSYLTMSNNAFTGDEKGAPLDVPTNQIFNNLVCAQLGKLMLGSSGEVIQETKTEFNFNIPGMSPNGICGSVDRVEDTKVDKALLDYIKQINDTAALPYAQMQYATNVSETGGTGVNYPSDEKIKGALQAAAWQYTADISALATEAAVETGGNASYQKYLAQFKAQAEASGWLYAGAMYLLILNIQKQSPEATKKGGAASEALMNSAAPLVTPYDVTSINFGAQDQPIFLLLLQNANNLTDSMGYVSSSPGVALKCTPLTTKTRAKDVMKDLTYDCNSVLSGWLSATGSNKTGDSTKTNYTPILNLAQWGQSTINKILISWVVILVAVTAGAVGNIVATLFGFGNLALVLATAMASMMAYLTPVIAIIMSIYWVNGTIAGYYIPMLPFVIYTVTAIGWFMLVIEAMVAAPLMALGILHPEGKHDIMGGAEAGFQILVGLFLRPMLMIVGFIAAGMMVTVIIDMVNAGFSIATLNLFATGKLISLWTSLVMLMMYMTTIFTLVNRGFTLIYMVPDRVLRWVGITSEQTNAEDVATIRQGAEKTAGIGQQAMKDLPAGAASGSQALSKGAGELKSRGGGVFDRD